jgi:hypothetical protein
LAPQDEQYIGLLLDRTGLLSIDRNRALQLSTVPNSGRILRLNVMVL